MAAMFEVEPAKHVRLATIQTVRFSMHPAPVKVHGVEEYRGALTLTLQGGGTLLADCSVETYNALLKALG